MGRKHRALTSAESMAVERDPTRVPGKPFLEHLRRVLNGYTSNEEIETPLGMVRPRGASVRQLMVDQREPNASHELAVNTPCLCYLQKLLYAMLTPTKSEYTGMITQWRLNAAFAQQLEKNPESAANLGAASPESILQLAGRLLEVDTLRLESPPPEANLPVPSDCDLLMFPKLTRLHLDGIDPTILCGLASVAETLSELQYSNGTIQSLSSLLAPEIYPLVKVWRNLRSIRVEDMQLAPVQVHEAAIAPNLETVVLRHVGLNVFGALSRCAWLSVLDLSHNHIYALDIPAGVFDQLRVLNLSHNHLSSIQSLQGCASLEAVDISYNLVLSLDDVRELASLQHLRSVSMYGNPVSKHVSYRQDVRRMLSEEVALDGVHWMVQDLEKFAGKAFHHEDATTSEVQNSVDTDAGKTTHASESRFNSWSAARGILRSCLAIGFAQIIVSTVWSRDLEAERLTMSIVAVTAGLGAISVTLALAASWLLSICRRRLSSPCNFKPRQSGEESDSIPPSTLRIQTFTRGFSMKLTDPERSLLDSDVDSFLHLDTLSDSLLTAVRAGDDLPIQILDEVCSQLKTILAYLSDPGGDGIGFAWLRMNRAISSFGHDATGSRNREEMVRERLGSCLTHALDANDPSTSFPTSLAKILPVIRLSAIVLSSVSSESDLPQVLRDAYVQVFASSHPWWRQRSILSAIAASPGTDAFLDWLGSPRAPNHRYLIESLHKCGERLHVLHASLQDLVDEHLYSFGHHIHQIS